MTTAATIVERVGRPWATEAVRMLEAGEGSVEAIDAAAEASGYRVGPLQRIDALGLDVDLALDRAMAEAHPTSTRFDPPALQERLVDEGRLGRASGRGFYRYDGDAMTPDLEVAATEPLSAVAIMERLELATVNEAYRAVEDGLGSPPAIDAAMCDAGYPRGPFEILDQLGLRAVIERLRAIEALTEERSGDQYRVATLLWQMANV